MGSSDILTIDESLLKIQGEHVGLSTNQCVLNFFKSNLKDAAGKNQFIIGTQIM